VDLINPQVGDLEVFERFTQSAIKVIMLAQEEARRLGHNFVGTEQILLGLIGEGEGAAALALRDSGVTLKSARVEVENIIGRGSGFVAVEIPFTPRGKRVLELSWDQARQIGDSFIGTEHLLMGLLCEGEGVAARVLENLHADLRGIREQMLYLRCETAEPLREPFFLRVFGPLLGIRKDPPVLSDSARILLERAQAGARAAGHWLVASDQMLLAILQDADCLAAKTLIARGITLDAARTEAEKITGTLRRDLGLEALRNTPKTDRIIALAHAEAQRQKRKETDVEDLLFGLLKEDGGVAMQVLENSGVDRVQLRTSLQAIRG
jgi:ATP-dependent Clp protease ATP-binding subunit ClpA